MKNLAFSAVVRPFKKVKMNHRERKMKNMVTVKQVGYSVVTLLCLGISTVCVAASKQSEKTIEFGVVPQQSASTLAKVWTPILTHLSKTTGHRFIFRTGPDIPTFEQRLLDGKYDIAYMNPYHYVVFNKNPGYIAIAKAKGKKINGILVVRKESQYKNLKDLNRQILAFPAPAAFAATVLPQSSLRQHGVDFSPSYVLSHHSVYRAVAKGLYPSGGGVVRTFNTVDPRIRDQLRILWKTPGYTPHAIAAHPNLPKSVLKSITEALVQLEQTKEGRNMLNALKIKGFESAKNSEWNDVRRLNINIPVGTGVK